MRIRLIPVLLAAACLAMLMPIASAHAVRSEPPVTREQFLGMMAAALRLPVEPANGEEPPFDRVLQAAREGGLYRNDYGQAWSQPISRGEMAVTLERATHRASFEAQAARIRELNQPDTARRLAELSRAYDSMDKKQAIFEAVRRGLMSGTGGGQLALGGTVSPDSAAAVIARAVAYNEGRALKADKRAMAAAEVYWHSTNLFTAWGGYLGIEHASLFDASQLHYESADFKGSITGLYIIDADDPDDPYRAKIPHPLRELYRFGGGHAFPLNELRDAYILVYTQTDNQLKNPKSKHPVRLQMAVSGIGAGILGRQVPQSLKDAERLRLAQGSLVDMQPVEHQAITKEQKALATHHVNGILLDNSLKNHIGVYVLPKSKVKAEAELRITIRPIINRNVKVNEVLRLRPNGILGLAPDDVTELYGIPKLD